MKASLNRANIVSCTRPETRRATYEQAEVHREVNGGPNAPMLQDRAMTCG